jgi:hypothetical protein
MKGKIDMSKRVALSAAAVVLMCVAGGSALRADHHDRTLAVTMTNDPVENRIIVYDAETHALLQTL